MSENSQLNRDMNILIVDDFVAMRRIMKTVLQQIGFDKIEEAADGSEALERLRAGGVDAIISDWQMPEMPGADFLRAVREDEDLKHLPMLIVAAPGEQDVVSDAVKDGPSDFIIKPFRADALEQKLTSFFVN